MSKELCLNIDPKFGVNNIYDDTISHIYINDKTKFYTTKGLITILNDNIYEKFPLQFLEHNNPYLLKFLIANNYIKIVNEYIYRIKHIPKDIYTKSNWNIIKEYINSKNIGDLINRTKYIEEVNEYLAVTSFDMYCNRLCKISILKRLKPGNYEIVKQIPKTITTTKLKMSLTAECVKGNLENVKDLVKQGAKISIDVYAPLRWAALFGHLEVVKYLVEQGSDITIENYLPLSLAASNNHLEIVNYFRKVLGNEIPCYECLVRATCLELCF